MGDDERFLALADSQRRADDRIETLAEAVEALAQAVAPARSPTDGEPAMSVLWWPALDSSGWTAEWTDLTAWLNEALLPRHSDVGRALSTCWSIHPSVIDELTMLRATWHNAYLGPQRSATAVGEWLDRWLPNARRRIEDELKNCQRDVHTAGRSRAGRDGTSVPLPMD